ncbi:MAG: SRPBCC family protein [Fimbriimonadaceae bacterium]|nr:SRPBCC family protein [Chitinophagales bacterium]
MKILKTIGVILLILIIIGAVLSFIAPTKMESERSITINAPKEIVWEHICSLQKQNEWGPWKEQDPNMKVEYSGPDCAVGGHSKWTSDVKEVGSGEQEIVAVEPMKSMETKLHFLEPWESDATGWTKMEDDPAGGVKVSWGFNSRMTRPMNAMMLFMNVDKGMNEMFDKGLSNLKTMAEKATAIAQAEKMKMMEM